MANPLRPLPAARFDYWHALHLLNRAGFGGTPAQVRTLASAGLDRAVAALVDYETISDEADAHGESGRASDLMRPATAAEQAMEREARRSNDEATLARLQRERQAREQSDREQLAAMRRWWIGRFLDSGRPLEEKMTLFWHGHFATGYRTIEDSWHMLVQNRLFRTHATGSFAALCAGVIRDPAMLEYLDNDENRRQSPNENLARELMELFTLGVGAYSERDIKEGARALTGYTFADDDFRFETGNHDPGPKVIFGRQGTFDGDGFLRLILARRECAEFLCRKLYRYFVNDTPGAADQGSGAEAVKAMAKELRDADYRIKPVLQALFASSHFYDAANRAAVVKSPIQLIAQSIRSYRTPVRSTGTLVEAADLMGQHLFQPPNVKGWAGGRAWINTSTLFVRQNLLVYLLTGRRPGSFAWETNEDRFDATHLVAELKETLGGAPTAEELAEFLLRFSLAAEPRPERTAALAAFLRTTEGAPENDRLLGALALITAIPEFQLC
jgi:uncharacterized protein (DUF1800 family)